MLSILSKLISIFYTADSAPEDVVEENDTIFINGVDISIPIDRSDDLIFIESTSLKTGSVYINDDYLNGKIDEKNMNISDNNITQDSGNNSLNITSDIQKCDNEPKIHYHEKVEQTKEYIRKTMYEMPKKEEECDKALLKKMPKKEEECDKALLKKKKKKGKKGKKRKRNGRGNAKNKRQRRK